MANKKISELTQTTSLTGEELVPIVSNGQNKTVKVKYLTEVPTKVSELENDKGYLTSIPSEYVTETELENKDYATESFVINKIAEAQLDGGEVNLDGLATKDDLNTKVDKVEGKGLSTNDYTTQEKNKLSGIENNANNYAHPEKHNASMIDGLANVAKSGSYNDLTNKPTIPSIQGLATEQYVDDAVANAQLGGGEGGTGVNLESYAKTEYVDNQIQEYTDGKKQRYVTNEQYKAMSEEEQNNPEMVWNILDPEEQPIPADLSISTDNHVRLIDDKGNSIGQGIVIDTDRKEVILMSPIGYGYRLIVSDEGQLSTERAILHCTSLKLDQTLLSLTVNESIQLNAIVEPIQTDDEIVWTASTENCTVDNGLVTAVSLGNCVITVTCGNFTASCDVTVIGAAGIVGEGLKYQHNETVTTTLTEGFDTGYNLHTEDNKDYTIFLKYDNIGGQVSDGSVESPLLTYGGLDGLMVKYYQDRPKLLCSRSSITHNTEITIPNETITICIVKNDLEVKALLHDGQVWASTTLPWQCKYLNNTVLIGAEAGDNSSTIKRYRVTTFHNLLIYDRALTDEEIINNLNILSREE